MHPKPLPCIILSLCCAILAFPGAASGEDWPRWRGPRGDGTWRGPRLADRLPDQLPVLWRRPLGGGYAGVSIANGRAYTMDRQPSDASPDGREVERVLCFDARSGEELWRHAYPVAYGDLDYGNGPRAAPTVDAGIVYTLGAMGHCCALDAKSGRLLWFKDFVREENAEVPEWGLAASPVVFENFVILHPGARPDGCLVALDRLSGREVWRASTDPAGYATPLLIDAQGDALLVAWTPEHVLGLSPRTGKVYWSIPYQVTYGVSIATPIHHDGIVFVTGYWEGSKAIRLANSGREAKLLWEENRLVRGLMSQPLVRAGYVYSLDKTYGLTCLELQTGTVLWNDKNQMTPRGRNPQATMVWLGEADRAIILNSEGELILARFTPSGYEEQSRAPLIDPTWAHPGYADDLVIARSDTQIVCARLPRVDAGKATTP